MIKPTSSLLAKILCWFFLNLALVAAALAVSFAFQPQVNLHAIFGQQISNRLRTAGMLISHDLNQMPRAQWADVLTRHAEIHHVDFALMLPDGSRFFSKKVTLPETVITRAIEVLGRRPPPGELPPHLFFDPQRPRENHAIDAAE